MVEGIAYRWLVRPKPTYCQGLTWGSASFTAELESSGKSTLIVTLDMPRPDNWVGEQGFVITPSLVAQAIKKALECGWKPKSKGNAYQLTLSVAQLGSSLGTASSVT